jgi:glycosyltransferase involved in cell wall biosynthesis
VLVGSHTRGWQAAALPPNVRTVGIVSDRRLRTLLRAAQVAFNPMTEGSGTNVKMLDYLASGLPIVTTQIGARGLDVVDGEHVVVAPLLSMVDAATELAADPATAERLARSGRQLVLERYSWDVALAPLIAAVRDLIGA